MNFAKQVGGLYRLVKLLPIIEIPCYRHLRDGRAPPSSVVEFHPRCLKGRPVWCRAGTTDAMVFWDTFHFQYHVPLEDCSMDANAVILDLGCNVGYTTAHFSVLYPQSRIIGMEMDEGNAEMAKRNTAVFGKQVEIIHGAAWIQDGEIAYDGDQEWGYRVSDLQVGKAGQGRKSPSFSLNTICEQFGLKSVDYVKMDIEGAEAEVLQKGTDWLTRVRSLSVEVHSPATMEDCGRWLKQAGLVCRKHPNHRFGIFAYKR